MRLDPVSHTLLVFEQRDEVAFLVALLVNLGGVLLA